jgi:hypothetical protein
VRPEDSSDASGRGRTAEETEHLLRRYPGN